jgi:hypothetical protein
MIIPLLFAAFTGALAPSSVVAARPSSGVSAPAKATASQGASPRGSRKTNPFGNLFGAKPTPRSSPPAQQAQWSSAQKRTVVCGMTVLPADPTIDPKIRVSAPRSGVRFTIRSVQPPVCQK